MLLKAWKMIDCAFSIYNRNDEKNQTIARQLEKREADIDDRQKNITEYLSQLMSKKLTTKEAEQIPLLLHCTNDVERMGDHTEIICRIIEEMQQNELKFSSTAEAEYDLLHDKLAEAAHLSAQMLTRYSEDLHKCSDKVHDELYTLLNKFETEHVNRINAGDCRPQVGILYLELLEEFRKIARHIFNINERAGKFYSSIPLNKRK
jgi:phosphate:Na+ symporter